MKKIILTISETVVLHDVLDLLLSSVKNREPATENLYLSTTSETITIYLT